jgi:hypothetical protein
MGSGGTSGRPLSDVASGRWPSGAAVAEAPAAGDVVSDAGAEHAAQPAKTNRINILDMAAPFSGFW